MSDIEKEFFEAFGIEPKEPCKYGYGCGHAKPCCPRKKCLPPLTSDIVLGLSKILMDFGWLHCEKFTIDKYLTEFDNDELKDKIQVVECNFEDCILKTCIKLKNEISKEVKALFKC